MPKKREIKKSPVRRKPKQQSFPLIVRACRELISRATIFSRRINSSSFRTKTLLLVGFFLILVPSFFYMNEGVQLAFFTPKVVPIASIFPIPTRIQIPSVNMDLPVSETAIRNGVWDIAGDSISHLTISARPREKGAIILYGHNTNDRFGPIRWLTKGKSIELLSGDGKRHEYTIEKTVEVNANQVSVLLSQKGETLILYTCSGFADLKRFIVIAKPI